MRSMAVVTASNSINTYSTIVHGTLTVRVDSAGMAQLNGELVYVACCPHEILTPSAKAVGKEPVPHCTKPCLHSAGWYNTSRTSGHTALLVSKVTARRET